MTAGRVLAFDPGSTRVGVAVSDPLRIVASPLEVIDRSHLEARLPGLVEEYQPAEIVVGLPVGLSGKEGRAAQEARQLGARIGEITGLPIHYVDERFTTATAEAALLEGGVKRRDRRRKVDRVAAAVILRQFLERSSGSERE
ncbi:MAG: Holliday junction resolvase RuvX [Acidimicrobiia bacterium]|nr:Holliday junction resolvase RuvX [Acidimicrobiia bacterium]